MAFGPRVAPWALSVVVLVLFSQSAETVVGDAEVVDVGPDSDLVLLDELGAAAPTATKSSLKQQLQAQNPAEQVKPPPLKKKVKQGAAELAKELSAMTDKDGKPVLVKENLPPSASPATAKAPARTGLMNAMMAGAPKKESKVEAEKPEPKFRKISYFKFSHLGSTKMGLTQEECENQCKADEKCLSYSYHAADKACLTSKSCLRYDLEFDFSVKAKNKKEGVAKFDKLGGLKYLYTGKSTNVTPVVGKSKEACKEACRADDSCKSFTYRSRDKLCLTSTQGVGYENGWSYFEKKGAAEQVAAEDKWGKPKKTTLKKLQNQFAATGTANLKKMSPKGEKKLPTAAKVENHSALTVEQQEYLAKKADPQIAVTQDAIVRHALEAKTEQFDAEEKARIAIAKMAAEKAKKVAEWQKTKESKGKEVYANDLRSSRDEANQAIEKMTKAGWKTKEQRMKDVMKAREKAKKARIEEVARKAREKTTKRTQEIAQKELEKQDAVKESAQRIEQAKADLKSTQVAIVTSLKRIDFLKSEEKRGVKMLAEAADSTKQDKLEATLTTVTADVKVNKKLEAELEGKIKSLDTEIPKVMKTAVDAKKAMSTTETAVDQDRLALKAEKDKAKAKVAASKLQFSKAAKDKADATYAHAEETSKTQRAELVTQQAKMRSTKTVLQKKEAAQRKTQFDLDAEKANRLKLKQDGKVLKESSFFQGKQELTNEKTLKKSVGGKKQAIVVAKELNKKHIAKLKKFRAKIAEEEKIAAEQAAEKKLKQSIKDREVEKRKEVSVADQYKTAKTNLKAALKMLHAAQYAVAKAVTVDEKVKAAQQEGDAKMLQTSSEEKIAELEPKLQKAKAGEANADQKVNQLKDSVQSDDKKVLKAEAKESKAAKQAVKVVAQGPAKIAKATEKIKVKMAKEEAKLKEAVVAAAVPAAAAAPCPPGDEKKSKEKKATKAEKPKESAVEKAAEKVVAANMTKAANKTSAATVKAAIAKEAEKTIELAKEQIKKAETPKSAKAVVQAVAPKLSELATLKIDEQATKVKLSKKQAAESKAKKSIEDAVKEKDSKAKRVDVTAQNAISEKAAKESTQKTDAKNQLQLKLDEKTQKKELAIKNSTSELAWITKPCDVNNNGLPMSLAAKESCSKDKEKKLASLQLRAKEKADKRRERMRLLERASKAKERSMKREQKSKAEVRKEKAKKEKENKEERKRKRRRELQRKADKRKEQAKKEKEKKAARKRTREEQKKHEEKQAEEKKSKEKKDKADRKAKQEKDLKKRKAEKEEERTAKKKKETASKAAEEKQQKTRKEKVEKAKAKERKAKEVTRKKKQAEKDKKADSEKKTKESKEKDKAKELERKNEKKSKEGSAKAAEQTQKTEKGSKEQSSKESKQKARDRELTAKKEKSSKETSEKTAEKTKKNELAAEKTEKANRIKQASERAAKLKKQEADQKESATKAKTAEAKTKSNEKQDKANEQNVKAQAAAAKAAAAGGR